MPEVQDVFIQCGDEYLKTHALSPTQAKAFRAIQNCRTAALGAHIDRCDECGYEKISYNSCRNRHCPKCQTLTRERWVERQEQYLLNTGYFHVVFTVPDCLNSTLLQNQQRAYNLLFQAVSETLLELCSDRKYLGATPGITAVLHTWGQNLMYHPHIHCIVTGGGLTSNGQWRSSRKKFFLPVKVLSKKFRGKYLSLLRQSGLLASYEAYQKDWVVYCKPPFKSPSTVIAYLGRYTHRVAISNSRLLAFENGSVSFLWRDYRSAGQKKIMTLSAEEFIRRFLLHVLPSGFRKIRHYGILASRDKTKRIALCRRLTYTRQTSAAPVATVERLRILFGQNFDLCPCCGIGHLARAAPPVISS